MDAGSASAHLRHAAAIALLAAFGTVLAPASPAAAHDMLEATEPAAGSTVASAPPTVRLTFMHTPIALGSQILVKDETGVRPVRRPGCRRRQPRQPGRESRCTRRPVHGGVAGDVTGFPSDGRDFLLHRRFAPRNGTASRSCRSGSYWLRPRTPRQLWPRPGAWPPSAPHSRPDWQAQPFTSAAGYPSTTPTARCHEPPSWTLPGRGAGKI